MERYHRTFKYPDGHVTMTYSDSGKKNLVTHSVYDHYDRPMVHIRYYDGGNKVKSTTLYTNGFITDANHYSEDGILTRHIEYHNSVERITYESIFNQEKLAREIYKTYNEDREICKEKTYNELKQVILERVDVQYHSGRRVSYTTAFKYNEDGTVETEETIFR